MKHCALLLATLLLGSPLALAGGGALPRPSLVDDKMYIYQDAALPSNHFVVKQKIFGEGMQQAVHDLMETNSTEAYSGTSCIECAVDVVGNGWGGWMFTHGYHSTDAEPQPNFGKYPDCGFDLTGADHLRFVAKGAVGGEQVEFFFGGLGWDPDTGQPSQPYPDSTPKISMGVIELTSEYTTYTLSLAGADLSYIACGFGFSVSGLYNQSAVRFYLDEIAICFGPEDAPVATAPSASSQPAEISSAAPSSAAPSVISVPVPSAAPPQQTQNSTDIPVAVIGAVGGVLAAVIVGGASIFVALHKKKKPKKPATPASKPLPPDEDPPPD